MGNQLNIGSITSGYRPIRDGEAFDRYFSQPEERDRIIIEDGEVEQTVDLMKRVVWKYIDDTKRIAQYLKSRTLLDTCENVWNFLYTTYNTGSTKKVWNNYAVLIEVGLNAKKGLIATVSQFLFQAYLQTLKFNTVFALPSMVKMLSSMCT